MFNKLMTFDNKQQFDDNERFVFDYEKKQLEKFDNEKKNEIISLADIRKLPPNVKISTITVTCKIGTELNIHYIARFMDRRNDAIISVKYGKNSVKHGKNFYGECTVRIRPRTLDKINNPKNNPVNMKIFRNGSLQLTGVKNMINFIEVIEILFNELKKTKAVIYENKLMLKPFIKDRQNLSLSTIQICMINSGFKLKHQVDREQLYIKLLHDKIKCNFEPLTHACVNIKFQYDQTKQVSIFVFESGAIIITGANNIEQISSAYNFIITKIKKYGFSVVLSNIDEMFEDDELKQFL